MSTGLTAFILPRAKNTVCDVYNIDDVSITLITITGVLFLDILRTTLVKILVNSPFM